MCVHDKLQPFTCQDGTHWDDSQKVAPQLPLLFLDYPSNHPSPQKINQRFATIPNLLVAPVMAVPLLLDLPLPLLGEFRNRTWTWSLNIRQKMFIYYVYTYIHIKIHQIIYQRNLNIQSVLTFKTNNKQACCSFYCRQWGPGPNLKMQIHNRTCKTNPMLWKWCSWY